MGISITIGRRTFTSAQYEELKKNKPKLLKDMQVCFSRGSRLRHLNAKGRKAASFRSLQMTNMRIRYDVDTKMPQPQSILSLKHMDIPDAQKEAIFEGKKALADQLFARLPKCTVNFKG
jgi:hypothetical protein